MARNIKLHTYPSPYRKQNVEGEGEVLVNLNTTSSKGWWWWEVLVNLNPTFSTYFLDFLFTSNFASVRTIVLRDSLMLHCTRHLKNKSENKMEHKSHKKLLNHHAREAKVNFKRKHKLTLQNLV